MMRRAVMSAALCTGLLSAPLLAAPRNTSWLQDVPLQAPATTETAIVYGHQSPDVFKAAEEGYDTLTLRLHSGLFEGLEATPLVTVEQRGEEPLRLHTIGLEARGSVWEKLSAPSVVAYGRFLSYLGEDRGQLFTVGGASRFDFGNWFFLADLRVSSAQGGQLPSAWEAWVGGSAGYAIYQPWQVTAALELFSIQPLAGERLSDPTFGLSAETATYYYAPSLSARWGPLWTTFSAASGYLVSEPASKLLLRWMVGVSH